MCGTKTQRISEKDTERNRKQRTWIWSKIVNREEEYLQKRIIDLANQSDRNGHYTFTGFLSGAGSVLSYASGACGHIIYTLWWHGGLRAADDTFWGQWAAWV